MTTTAYDYGLDLDAVPPASLRRRIGIALGAAVFALVLVGQGLFVAEAIRGGTAASAPPRTTGPASHRLEVALLRALGPSDRGVPRLRLRIVPLPRHRGERVDIEWAINSDLAGGTVGNGAAAEVYTMLRIIYSSHLPVSAVNLTGTYPVGARGRDSVVMRLAMGRKTASLVGSIGWDNVDPLTLWPLVERDYVAPSLQPQSGD
jgi:hypothetical protein